MLVFAFPPCFLGLTVVGTGMSCLDVTPWEGDIPTVDTVFATASPGRGFVRLGSRQAENKHSRRGGTVPKPAPGVGHLPCHPWQGGGPRANLVAALPLSLQVPSVGQGDGGDRGWSLGTPGRARLPKQHPKVTPAPSESQLSRHPGDVPRRSGISPAQRPMC